MSIETFSELQETIGQRGAHARPLRADVRESLLARFERFKAQNPEAAAANLAFVPLIAQHGFAAALVPQSHEAGRHDVMGSIGYHYTFGVPELMLVDRARVGAARLGALIRHVGRALAERSHAPEELSPADAQELLGQKLALAAAALRVPVQGLAAPTPELLDEYPYGYGWYFYKHFTDTPKVPLLVARVESVPDAEL